MSRRAGSMTRTPHRQPKWGVAIGMARCKLSHGVTMVSLACVEPTWRCVLGYHCSPVACAAQDRGTPFFTAQCHASSPPTYSFVLSK